jgi:HprK-related kinase B
LPIDNFRFAPRARGVALALAVRDNLNQAVNLVNHLYAADLMARGFRLFHASAVVRDDRALVLAGVPGTGKSTASLHFVEAGWRFLSNDRVLARCTEDSGSRCAAIRRSRA